MDKECRKEPIGSDIGTILVTAEKSSGGIKVLTNGTAFELLNTAAILVDNVAVSSGLGHEDAIAAFIELLAAQTPTDKEEK